MHWSLSLETALVSNIAKFEIDFAIDITQRLWARLPHL